jgi:hypothetical protein
MLTISKEEIPTLPAWVRDFLGAAWSAPDADGMRYVKEAFDGMDVVGQALARGLEEGLNDPKKCKTSVHFGVQKDGWGFEVIQWPHDKHLQYAQNLSKLWTNRFDLHVCIMCGATHHVGKGKTALFCSTACRVKAHRERTASAHIKLGGLTMSARGTVSKKGGK